MRHTSDHVAIDLVTLAILRYEGKVVLVQQQSDDKLSSYWVLPGGLVEAGELVSEALIREVQEEAGVHVETIAHLVCLSQIDRPAHQAQTVVYIFEVETWHGELGVYDPDAEVIGVELLPLAEAIERLHRNGGWPGIQTPLLAYLQREVEAGAVCFYREDNDGQHLVGQVTK